MLVMADRLSPDTARPLASKSPGSEKLRETFLHLDGQGWTLMQQIALIQTRSTTDISCPPVTVEVHILSGLPALIIVGLPATAVKESRERVRSAITSCGLVFPQRRIVVNLAPADLPKDGSRFDLPIAIGILAASQQLATDALAQWEFAGELALTGTLRPTSGLLAMAAQVKACGHHLLTDQRGAAEAALVHPGRSYGARTLRDVYDHLRGRHLLPPACPVESVPHALPDLIDVRGQARGRRALEIAAAGGHSLLLIGPPGTGKSMLAERLPGLLPPLTDTETLESAAVQSLAIDGFDAANWGVRPFRAPHHTASATALTGGGHRPRPGEVSLAHHGVLFLDELAEFGRDALEALREPLESGQITISRARGRSTYPARLLLVAAMNPCPCGYADDPEVLCDCRPETIRRYRRRISGPLLDRFDLRIELPRLPPGVLSDMRDGETSSVVRQRVERARNNRPAAFRAGYAGASIKTLESLCQLDQAERDLLSSVVANLSLSTRGYGRLLAVARTIADLAGSPGVTVAHLGEAVTLRRPLH